MLTILIFSLILLVVSIFVIVNLLNKVEKYEADILLKDEFIKKLKEVSEQSYRELEKLDTMQAFESDDEVGFFFKKLKEIIITIDGYTKNYLN